MKKWESEDGKVFKWLLVLPKLLRKKVLDSLHSSKTAGHLGREKTLPKVRERFYWVGMSMDVRAYVKQCADCARKKNPPRKHRAPLQQLSVGAPLERVAIDVLGPLTETHQGNSYILFVGDYWTKWMEAYAIPDQQAEMVATKLVDEFICRFGVPQELHSDQGRNFESEVFQVMCQLLGIRKTRTTAYNPKSDGKIHCFMILQKVGPFFLYFTDSGGGNWGKDKILGGHLPPLHPPGAATVIIIIIGCPSFYDDSIVFKMGMMSFSPPFKIYLLSLPFNSLNSIMNFLSPSGLIASFSLPRVSINVSRIQVTYKNIPVPQFLTSSHSLSFSQVCIHHCFWKSVVRHPHDMTSPSQLALHQNSFNTLHLGPLHAALHHCIFCHAMKSP